MVYCVRVGIATTHIMACKIPSPTGRDDLSEGEIKQINELVLSIDKTLRFKQSEEEVKDITQAVNDMVDVISSTFGTINQAYEISHKYFVGSMAEGTRLHNPDEFDFLVVLKRFSVPENDIKVDIVKHDSSIFDRLDDHKNTHANVKIKTSTFSDILETCDDGTSYINASTLNKQIKTVSDLSWEKCKHCKISKPNGVLSMSPWKPDRVGPACTYNFRWKATNANYSQNISVDVVLAIEVDNLNNTLTQRNIDTPNNEGLEENPCLLLPVYCDSRGKCFKLAFTNEELKLVKKMSENHRLCFRVVKYLLAFNVRLKFRPLFSSYQIKSFVLKHISVCQHDSSCFICVNEILSDISASFNCYHSSSKLDKLKTSAHLSIREPFVRSDFVCTQLCSDTTCEGTYSHIAKLKDLLITQGTANASVELFHRHFDMLTWEAGVL